MTHNLTFERDCREAAASALNLTLAALRNLPFCIIPLWRWVQRFWRELGCRTSPWGCVAWSKSFAQLLFRPADFGVSSYASVPRSCGVRRKFRVRLLFARFGLSRFVVRVANLTFEWTAEAACPQFYVRCQPDGWARRKVKNTESVRCSQERDERGRLISRSPLENEPFSFERKFWRNSEVERECIEAVLRYEEVLSAKAGATVASRTCQWLNGTE